MTADRQSCGELLDRLVHRLPPVDLDEVMRTAALQTRVDRKYLLSRRAFERLSGCLTGLAALQIDGRRVFDYESVYFDTADLQLYREHRQGRRLRYKVRTRSYLDSGECLLEVKVKGRRGETVKERTPYPVQRHTVLDRDAMAFAADVLRRHCDRAPAVGLGAAAVSRYRRATLVDPGEGSRITLDVDLSFERPWHARGGVRSPDLVILETKSRTGTQVDRLLRSAGVRPVSMSKYCLGVTLLQPQLPGYRWNRMLREEFGWRREPARLGAGCLDSTDGDHSAA